MFGVIDIYSDTHCGHAQEKREDQVVNQLHFKATNFQVFCVFIKVFLVTVGLGASLQMDVISVSCSVSYLPDLEQTPLVFLCFNNQSLR